jgi:hypothetical protein
VDNILISQQIIMSSEISISRAQEEAVASIARCSHLASFLKKRIELEQSYSADLRKLCKDYGIAGSKKPNFSINCSSGSENIGEEAASLWKSFYEMVDDCSQLAKGHSMLGETLATQVVEPLQATIKSMEASRKTLVEQAAFLKKEQAEAKNALKKAQCTADNALEEADKAKTVLSTLQAKGDVKSKPLDKAKLKAQVTQERYAAQKQVHRQCEDKLATLLSKHQSNEYPRLLEEFRGQAAQRAFDAYKIINAMVEIEKARMEVEDKAVEDMRAHLREIDLSSDMQQFDLLCGYYICAGAATNMVELEKPQPRQPHILKTKSKTKSFNELSQQLIVAASELNL